MKALKFHVHIMLDLCAFLLVIFFACASQVPTWAMPLSTVNIQSTATAGEPIRGQSLFEQTFGRPSLLQQILAQLPASSLEEGSGTATNNNNLDLNLEVGQVSQNNVQTPQNTATGSTVIGASAVQASGSNGQFVVSNQGATTFTADTDDGEMSSGNSAGTVTSSTGFGQNGQLQLLQGEQGSSTSQLSQHNGAVQLAGSGENFNANVQTNVQASHTSVSGTELTFDQLRCKVFGRC